MAHSIKCILVPVDFSTASRAALWRAGELATALGATIELLHVVDLPQPLHVISEGHVPLPPEYRRDVLRGTEGHLTDLRLRVSHLARFLLSGPAGWTHGWTTH